MGMFSIEQTRTYTCPVCSASTSREETNSMSGNTKVTRLGSCGVCGWSRAEVDHTRNKLKVKSHVNIPSSAEPREGIQKLAENAGISIPDAADVLNNSIETTLSDIQGETQDGPAEIDETPTPEGGETATQSGDSP